MRIMTIIADNENIEKIKHGFEVNNFHPTLIDKTLLIQPILDYQLCLAKSVLKKYVSDFHENECINEDTNIFKVTDQVKVFLSQEEMTLYK